MMKIKYMIIGAILYQLLHIAVVLLTGYSANTLAIMIRDWLQC